MKFLFKKRGLPAPRPGVLLSVSALALAGLLATTTIHKESPEKKIVKCCNNPDLNHVCIMKTILGIDTSQEAKLISTFKTPEKVGASVKKGLEWME